MTALLTTPHPEAYGELPSAARAPRPSDWSSANSTGLMQAATGDWQGACDAFRTAVTAIQLGGQTTASAGQHSPLALVLSNLAQALHRTGAVQDAIACQERVVALRIAMTGEGSVAVARSRSDLAAMLGSIGRVEEAAVLARRALMAVESSGAPDMALAAVLANAARIAIVADAARDAEPILRRLHAVEARCGMDSTATDRLLERIGAAPVTPPAGSPMLVDLDDVFPAPTSSAPISPTVRYPSPAPLAFTHEIEFVDDVEPTGEEDAVVTDGSAIESSAVAVVESADETIAAPIEASVDASLDAPIDECEDGTDDVLVGEYPRVPTSEQAAHAFDVRASDTWRSPEELPASGAYHLVESAESAVAAAWESTESEVGSTEPAVVGERRVAHRRNAERRSEAPLHPEPGSRRTLFVAGGVVVAIGIAAIVAIFR